MKQHLIGLFFLFLTTPILAKSELNVYAWGGEIPQSVISQFQQETGIHVNFSTYDSNETLHAKLKANRHNRYDVILPSGYYVERMKKRGMLVPLDHKKIPNLINLNPFFANNTEDLGNQYSIPLTWGITGIFYNKKWIAHPPTSWNDLWKPGWHNQLLLLDDAREVFSMALLSLGYSPNDTNPTHLKEAAAKLLKLIPNIKLFASEAVQALLIDEEARVGAAWTSDVYKSQGENAAVQFVYPKEGFVIWDDCLAIPANPPHLKEAYVFINFMLRPDVAAHIANDEGLQITNQKGIDLLPEAIRKNPLIYPSETLLKQGIFQRDIGEQSIALINDYWEQFKLSF